jgi:two-component system CheB/CheR fusion protein
MMDSLSKTTTKIRQQQEILESINTIFREALMCESDIDVAQQCLKLSEKLTGSKFGLIGELNEAGLFDTIAISNPGWDACRMPGSEATKLIKNMPLRGVDRSTFMDGKSRIVNDIDSHPDHIEIPKEHPKITCFLGIPLKRNGRTIGMIGLANREGGYTSENQETIEALSTAFVEALYHKRMEKGVEKSEERYRRITNAITDYIYTVHIKEGRTVKTVHNPNSVFVTSYTPEELTAAPDLLIKMVHDEDREAVHRQVSQCLSGQDIEPLEH